MNKNDIYQIDFTRTFPTALQHDPKMIALAKSLAAELLTVSGHMEDVLIYSRFDQLPEELVDILAYDMHVDWYDYDMPLKVKREVVKNSVKVHKRMGTKYATETALGSIFPGAKIQEWFEYGGKPYFFRAVVGVTEDGITLAQKKQVLRGIHFYKNLRSHMDEIEFNLESTGFVRIGAVTTARHTLEIWPEVKTKLEITDAEYIGAVALAKHTLEIWPELPTQLEITGAAGVGAVATTSHVLEVWPELPARLEITAKTGAGGLYAQEHTVEVFPEVATSVEVTGKSGAGGLTAQAHTVEIFPDAATQVELVERAGAGGLSASLHTVEVYPELPARLEMRGGSAGVDGIAAMRQTVEIYPENKKEE